MRLVMFMVLWVAMVSTACAGGVPIVFECPSDRSPDDVYVQFLNTGSFISGTYQNGKGETNDLKIDHPYSLKDITGTSSVGGGAPAGKPAVLVSEFNSGRIYINYTSKDCSKGLNGLKPGYQPSCTNSGDTNYSCRYQYLEPTVTPNANGNGAVMTVDLSYIDFFSISLSMAAMNATHATNSPQITDIGSIELANRLNGVEYPGGTSNILPAGARIPGFARIIAPGHAVKGTYHDWSTYAALLRSHRPTRISGLFAGVGKQPTGDPFTQMQTYDYLATFGPDMTVTLTAQSGSGNGEASFIPSKLRGKGLGEKVTITIKGSDLDGPNGVYGCNPSYTVERNGTKLPATGGIVNDVTGWVVGDLLAGMNFGYPGSKTKFQKKIIATMDSVYWWGGLASDGKFVKSADTPAGNGMYYSDVQDERLNFNPYADILSQYTPGYGFPLGDRAGQNLLTLDTGLDPNGYLVVTINPDVK